MASRETETEAMIVLLGEAASKVEEGSEAEAVTDVALSMTTNKAEASEEEAEAADSEVAVVEEAAIVSLPPKSRSKRGLTDRRRNSIRT